MLMSATLLALTTTCPTGATCLEAERLLVVASDPERAQTIFDTALGAQSMFEAQFGIEAANIAVVEDIQTFPGLAESLSEDGYAIKPWISPAMMRSTLEAQIRPAMQSQLSQAGLSQAAIDAQIETVLRERVDQNENVRHQDAIIPHELGHIWLMEGFDWPQIERTEHRVYGAAAAPDWLDETFAVAMETDALTSERRASMCSDLSDGLQDQVGTFFTMEHPLLAAADAAANARARVLEASGETATSGPSLMVTSLESLGVDERAGVTTYRFYNLSRVMVDYAQATTGGVAAFSDLSTHIAEGGSQRSWLAEQNYGWPSTIEGLSHAVTQFVETGCSA